MPEMGMPHDSIARSQFNMFYVQGLYPVAGQFGVKAVVVHDMFHHRSLVGARRHLQAAVTAIRRIDGHHTSGLRRPSKASLRYMPLPLTAGRPCAYCRN